MPVAALGNNNREMFQGSRSPAELEGRAAGLLLGFAMAQHQSDCEGAHAPTEALLVDAVSRHLLTGGGAEEGELLRSWVAAIADSGQPQATQTELVLEGVRSGRSWTEARATAARITLRPSLDPPLLRTLPLAVACVGRGWALRSSALRVTSATHDDPSSQLAGFAVARLAQDLLAFDLEDALPRTAQAVREDAPESLLRALRPAGLGEVIPDGEDAQGVLAGAVQAVVGAADWTQAVERASSRGLKGDQAVLLAGALAGALFGVEGSTADLPAAKVQRVRERANALLRHSQEHAADPLPPPTRLAAPTAP